MTSGETAITASGISKRYVIGTRSNAAYGTARDAIAGLFRPRHEQEAREFWALRDLSFEVKRGEVLGVIGRNGAGKSTLLKILTRITEPTDGWAEVTGRVGALLEVGSGFHMELTGRENTYLNGAILGMSRHEIDRKFDAIVEFAEVTRFVDTPVKRYSSGMRMRLAFSVAAHLDPDVLIVDEVLAVGDVEFQRKCLGTIADVASEGRTVLFVSHSMAAISSLCTRALLLEHGQIAMDGEVEPVIGRYVVNQAEIPEDLSAIRDRGGAGTVRFNRFEIFDETERLTDVGRTGSSIMFRLHLNNPDRISLRSLIFQIYLNASTGQRVLTCSNRWAPTTFDHVPAESVVCKLPSLPLVPGEYSVELVCKRSGAILDHIWSAKRLLVVEGDFFGTGRLPPPTDGSVLVKQSWESG